MAKQSSKKSAHKNPFNMDPQEAIAIVESLTPRERQVAELISMGLPQVDIAKELGISTKTLDIHRGNVKEKFHATLHGIGRIWFCAKASAAKD